MVAKRKVAASTSATNKKARTDTSRAEALVQDILADPLGFEFSEDDDVVRQSFIDLANYISFLKDSLESAQQSGPSTGPAPKTAEELELASQKLAKAAVSGIKKQMNWRPSCKTGTAKFNYDGVCADPAVFGHMLGLDGPPTFKMKKFPIDEFENLIGGLDSSVRYSKLYVKSDVNVRWNPETGEFKFSGTYGVP